MVWLGNGCVKSQENVMSRETGYPYIPAAHYNEKKLAQVRHYSFQSDQGVEANSRCLTWQSRASIFEFSALPNATHGVGKAIQVALGM